MEPVTSVPLLDLKLQLQGLREELLQTLTEVLDSSQYIMGPKVTQLESSIAQYTGAAQAVGVSSGTDALLLALMALEVGPGDAVITTNFSFFATAGVISRLNARPIFVDIDPVTFNLSPLHLEEVLGRMPPHELQRVKALIPVHLYGQCADMERLAEIAKHYHLPMIEDAAQAIGAECYFQGQVKQAGTMGTMGCYSFFPTKNLGGMGDGGMVVTNSAELGAALRLRRTHGAASEYQHSVIGGNFRLDALQAAVLQVKLPHLNGWHQQRQHNAQLYTQLLQEFRVNAVQPPTAVYPGLARGHIYNQYMIRVPRRDELQAFLTQHKVATKVYYPTPFHQQECFRALGYQAGDFPESERAAKEILGLPIYPELTPAQQEYVVEKIATFYAQ